MRQQEFVGQCAAPADQPAAIRRLPKPGDQRAQQKRLQQGHARMRRHFETAQFKQAQARGAGLRRIKLVDAKLGAVGVAGQVHQQMPKRSVTRHKITVRVLLLVQKMRRWFDFERIAQDRRARVRGRFKPDFVRAQGHQSIKAVVRYVGESNLDGHQRLISKE